MINKLTTKKISIKELSLWDENPRFPDKYFNKNEKELIGYMASKESFELLKLAKEIVDGFDTPPLEKLVVFKSGSKHIVLEGNRRLACYKLLINPKLINAKTKKEKLKKLKSKISIDGGYKIDCIVAVE